MQPTERFPFETLRVPGSAALATWERLRREARGWPLVLGGDKDFERHCESFEFTGKRGMDGTTVLAAAAAIDFPPRLRSRQGERLAAALEELSQVDPQLARHLESIPLEDEEPPHGEWEAVESPGLSVAQEYVYNGGHPFTRPYPEVVIAMMPTDNGADAIGLLGFGGWNACPFAEEHVAAWRYWNRLYGAEVIGVSGEVINARVRTRPNTRAAAMALALEQLEYCSDLVTQGVGTIEALAATLMAHDWWYFWWD